MTAITVGDTYGEAKYEAGASDTEATLLTLGYAAAEAALLNTGVGEWILPELKASGLKTKAIIIQYIHSKIFFTFSFIANLSKIIYHLF